MATNPERDLFAGSAETPSTPSLDKSAPNPSREIFTTDLSQVDSPVRTMTAASPPPAAPPSQQPLSTPVTPASQTNQQPAGAVNTAPVVAAPVLSTVDKDKETVAGQLRELLSANSPVLKQARDRAQVFAAGRGLQNSSLAAQAGEEAVIAAATPIAATDAQTYANRAILNTTAQNEFGGRQQQFEQQQQLMTQDHFQKLIEQAQAGDINSRLQLEQAGYNSNLSAQENRQRLEQLAAEGDIQGKLALQQFNYQSLLATQQQGFAIELSDKAFQQNQQLLVDEYAQRLGLSQAESQMTIDRMNVQHSQTLEQIAAQGQLQAGADSAAWTRNLQAAYLNSVTQRQMQASQEIQTIYSTQGLTSAQQTTAVQNARARLQSDINALAAYFQQTPGWPTTPGGSPGPVPGQPVPPQNTPVGPRNPPIGPISTLGPGEWGFEMPIGPPGGPGGGARRPPPRQLL